MSTPAMHIASSARAIRSVKQDSTPRAMGLHSLAKEVLEQSKYDQERALPALIAQLEADATLRRAVLHEAASSALREAASQQRMKMNRQARAGVDNARGLAVIAGEGYLDTYLLLNRIRLGDATDEDLAEAISSTYSQEQTLKEKRFFLEAIRKDKKFKKGKRVRDCFTDLEVARLAQEYFKC